MMPVRRVSGRARGDLALELTSVERVVDLLQCDDAGLDGREDRSVDILIRRRAREGGQGLDGGDSLLEVIGWRKKE